MSSHQWEDAKSQAEQQQLSSKTIASTSGANQRRPIISLLKLKSYMPLHQTTSAGLFSKAMASSSSSNLSSYKDFYANHHRLARGKVTGLSTDSSTLVKPEADTPTREVENYNSRLVTNQVVTAAQQELAESIVDATAGNQSLSSNSKTVSSVARKEAEGEELGIRVQRQDRLLVTGERKLKRTDSADNGKSLKCSSRRVDHKSCISKHNMTPSSLLLLQNHNYIEHQRIPPTDYSYGSYIHQQQQPPHEDEDLQVGHSRVSTEDCSEGVSLNSVKQSNDQNQSITEQPSDSTPSLMLPNSSQFKHLGRIDGNTSGNSLNTNSSANLTDYPTNSDLNLDHNHTNGSDHLTVNRGNNTPQQNYHPNLTSCDPKASSGVPPFLQYGTSSRSTTNEYQPNFQPLMVEHQVKLENSSAGRNMFEEGNSIVVDHNNIPAEINHVDNLDVPRNLAQHQAMNSINQYYNSHYNSMPTSSSKSTSPTSSTSTPSPKIAPMHLSTSQHPNQLAPNAVASSQVHMDHLNQHYMSSNIQPAMGTQSHHVNQQYSYHQPAANGLVQHPLSVPVHDQTYSHHAQQHQNHHHQQQLLHQQQQQHHQQHQQIQQHQHLQHQHQQQNHQQQQQHLQQQQHQNMTNQHSIYHHLTNNAGVNVDHIYGTATSGAHYQAHLHHSAANQQSSHIMSGNHQNHLNTAAACAAAVVSQTLKTVASHHGQHQYGGSMPNGFGASTGSLMNVSPQNHAQFHPINPLNTNTLDNQTPVNQQQHQQNIPVHHTTTIVTRKYQCKMCPQVFMSKAEMKYHNQNHMREAKPYKCLQCAKAFANSSYLSQHMRIHQGVKPYTCDICSRKFTQLSHLQQHKRTHTGDKPYKCNYMNCTKQFSQLSNLQSHSRCHQLDKPYKCNSCYKCFHDEQSLLEHIPRHLESKHLKKNLCIFCGSSYQQERGLVKHFQQYHTDKSPTLVAAAIAAGTTGNTALIASLVSTTAPSNVFVAPSSGVGNCGGSSSSSSTTSSLGSSGNLNIQNNHIPPHSTPISRY